MIAQTRFHPHKIQYGIYPDQGLSPSCLDLSLCNSTFGEVYSSYVMFMVLFMVMFISFVYYYIIELHLNS